MGRPARIAIIANGRQARAELQRTAMASERLGKTVSRAGKLVAGAFAISGITRATKAILANGDAYTSQLNKIEALTTAQQRAQVGGISGVAKQLEAARGAYAKYGNTIGDAAAGVTELVKAGQTLPQALKSVNATLVLAKAGEMDVADASQLVATALKTWNLPARRAGDVANYLANAANISTSDVTDLGEALKFVAPVAAKVGVNAQTTAAYLAQLSNAGIKGTLAGTGLRKVLESLQAPTGKAAKVLDSFGLSAFDAQGQVRPFGEVMRELRDRLNELPDVERKADLRAIFGLTGITSAQVLLDNVNSLGEYTKGITRAGAAQKLAEANSKGLMGTLRRARALFLSTGQAAYRAFSPVVDKAIRPMVDALERNQGALTAQARTIGSRVLPYLKSFANVLGDAAKAARDVAQDFKPFAKVLGAVAAAVKAAADVFHAIPGPIKALALQAGIAALVLPRLSAGVTNVTSSLTLNIARLRQWRAELSYTATRAQAVGAVTGRLSTALKGVAGVGGMVALTKGAGESNKALSTLQTTAGAAALGFSVGGPWGAAIGGAAGLALSLAKAFRGVGTDAQEAARKAAAKASWSSAKQAVQDLTDALHGTVRAYNEVTAAAVQKGFRNANGQIKPWVQSLLDAGVSMDTLTRATLGQSDAQKILARAQGQVDTNLAARKGMFNQAKQALADYNAELRKQSDAGGITTPQQALEQQRLTDAVKDAKNQYRDYASSVAEGGRELKAFGGTLAQQNALEQKNRTSLGLTKKAYDSLPRDVRIKVEEQGAPQSKTAVLDFIKTAKLTPKEIVSVLKATGTTVSKKDAASLKVAYDKLPKSVTTKVGVTGLAAAKGQAASFGSQAGSAYGSGFVGGIAAWQGRAEFAAAAMAGAAHAAAMHRLDAHSPSRLMVQVGKWFAQGFAIGIRSDASKVLAAVETLYDKVDKAQDKALARAPKSRRKALQKQFREQDRDLRKLVKTYAAGKNGLNAIVKAQDAVNQKIDDAKQKVADAKQAWIDYRDSVKASVVAFGDVTQLGKNSAGNATADAIVKQLTIRRNAVKKYLADILALKKAGLNGTALQQIIDAGVDGGLQTAEALLAGGKGTIATVNALQSQIAKAGNSLGTSMANNFKQAGINAAQGLLDGLTKERARLNKVAEALADGLVNAIKRKLKIKSPSRVFKEIGRYNVEGLRIGMDSTYVKRTGELTAAALVKGYGTPALSAVASTPGLGSRGAQHQVQLTLTAEQGDALVQGRRLQGTLDLAGGMGVRRLS